MFREMRDGACRSALAPLVGLVVVLMGIVLVLGTWLSLAPSVVFLALPTGLLHLLLRAFGHH